MRCFWLTALAFCCFGLATLVIAGEPHNSHPADGDPLMMLDFETADFSFIEVEVRERTPGGADGWTLKGFLNRHDSGQKIPFAVVLTRESVSRANRQWDFGDERRNILATLKDGEAVTHFDLEPVDGPERTVLIEDVKNGMSGRVTWDRDLDREFGRVVFGARSGAHAAAMLSNAFFTHIAYFEHVKNEGSEAPSFVTCFESAERACVRTRRDGSKAACVELFRWSSSGACSFSCKTRAECMEDEAAD